MFFLCGLCRKNAIGDVSTRHVRNYAEKNVTGGLVRSHVKKCQNAVKVMSVLDFVGSRVLRCVVFVTKLNSLSSFCMGMKKMMTLGKG